jgi:hypothetical protein
VEGYVVGVDCEGGAVRQIRQSTFELVIRERNDRAAAAAHEVMVMVVVPAAATDTLPSGVAVTKLNSLN